MLRWIENPRGRIAGFRALRLVPGVGPATAIRWLDELDERDRFLSTRCAGSRPQPSAGEAWPSLIALSSG